MGEIAMAKRYYTFSLGNTKEDWLISKVHMNIGRVYTEECDFVNAMYAFNTALHINLKLYSGEDMRTVEAQEMIAHIHTKQGNNDLAVCVYTLTLAMRKRVFGKDHLQTAETLNKYAHMHVNR